MKRGALASSGIDYSWLTWDDILAEAGIHIVAGTTKDLERHVPASLLPRLSRPMQKGILVLMCTQCPQVEKVFTDANMEKILDATERLLSQKKPRLQGVKLRAPSEMSKLSGWKELKNSSKLKICDHIPVDVTDISHDLPVVLQVKEFGTFVTEFQADGIPDENVLKFAVELMFSMSSVFDTEAERVVVLKKIFSRYEVSMSTTVTDSYRTDAEILCKGKVVVLFEFKNTMGIGTGSPNYQNIGNYLHTCKSEDPVGRHPILLVTIAGCDYFQVFGAVWNGRDKLCIDPLTPPMSLVLIPYESRKNIVQVARALSALETSIRPLADFETTNQDGPYFDWDSKLTDMTPIRGKPRVFRALKDSKKVVVKFVQQYGKEVHESLSKAGLAPQLYTCEKLVGDWMAVVMEAIEGDTLVEGRPDDFEGFLQKLKAKLDAHQFVHGDLRAPNIVFDDSKIRIVDFDWAGKNGEARYPLILNSEVDWHKEVGPNKLIRPDHDSYQLNKLKILHIPPSSSST